MTTSNARLGEGTAPARQQVQDEIEGFLRALTSYPDRFARNPQLSFEQHLLHIWQGQPSDQSAASD